MSDVTQFHKEEDNNRESNSKEVGVPAFQNSLTLFKKIFLKKVMREPLLQFLFIGAAIFVGVQLTNRWRDNASHTVIVDGARVNHLSQLYKTQMGREPSADQLEYLIDSYIRDEIFYREALAMGLNRDDEIVRRRLIQKLEFLRSDLTKVPAPTEEELQAYFQRHAIQFASPATVTFKHLYFSPDGEGNETARQAAAAMLATISGDNNEAARGGDPFPLQYAYSGITETEAAKLFGRTPLVTSLFSVPERRWQGPFRSGYGWHLVFVDRRVEQSLPAFADVRDQVRDAWLEDRRNAANAENFSTLKKRYHIVRRDLQEKNL